MPMSCRARTGIGFPRLAATRLATSRLGRELLLGPEQADRGSHLSIGYAALAQFRGEHPAAEATPVVPALHPCPGERGVVDQADLANRPKTDSATSSGIRRLRSAV